MNRLNCVIAATVVAIAAAGTGAEAGFSVRLTAPAAFSQLEKTGCGGSHARVFRRHVAHQSVRRVKRDVDVAARTVDKPKVIAKAEPETPAKDDGVQQAAEIENSSIVAATDAAPEIKAEVPLKKPALAAKATAVKPVQKVAAIESDPGCKTFFASVGMTLSVPCAK